MNDLASLARFLLTALDGTADSGGGSGDCAAITNPTGSGHLLFAAVNAPESLAPDNPWLAGYAAAIANFSDIAAMGGRPIAITSLTLNAAAELTRQGIEAASGDYGVPIVAHHPARLRSGKSVPGAAVLGHAGERLVSRHGAEPGHQLIMVVDLHGGFHEGGNYWDSTGRANPERLRAELELLPLLAEKGLCRAGRRIGRGGIIGALRDLCAASETGAVLDLEALPCPMDVEIGRWLVAVPSYGHLLAIAPEDFESTMSHFTATRITCRRVGHFTAEAGIVLTADGQAAELTGARPLDLALAAG